MAQLLILGNRSTERQGLALFMEFAGHSCTETDSLQDAVQRLRGGKYDLVLADAAATDAGSEQIVRTLKNAAPGISVMILTEEGSPAAGMDDVITSPLTSLQSRSPQFPPLRKGEAFLVLLPERDSLKMLPDLPQTAGLLNKLALLYHAQQKFTAAEQLCKRALEISEKTPGDRTREEASIVMNLASIYQDQEKYSEAEKLYARSLKLAEKAYGPNHPKVARRLRHLAETYRLQGKDEKAAPLHARLQKMN
jgi:CheY-like chemotaxis protein